MGRLVDCKTCGGKVSDTTFKCPHCGQRNPGVSGLDVANNMASGCLGLFVVAIVISVLLTFCSTVIK